MTTLYIEPFGGMAGDMLLAALLDLNQAAFAVEDLRTLGRALVPGEAELELERAWRGNLSGNLLHVRTDESNAAPHRHYADLKALLERADLSERVRANTLAALWRLAEAEARVHGTTPDEIHFHEVGAVDTLIDIAGAMFALERLGVERVVCSPALVGSGTVQCAHGEMPVPAPAVAELMRGVPTRVGGGCERLTPTAAAILRVVVDQFDVPAAFTSKAIGYGAGHSDPTEGPPNLCRVQLGTESSSPRVRADVLQLAVNLDDMSAAEIGHVIGKLRAAGGLEVWSHPVQMKKDRPGTVVCALARADQRAALEAVVFEWTTTLGVRWTAVERSECERSMLEVAVAEHRVRVKLRERPDVRHDEIGPRDLAPEYDDLVPYAEANGLTLREARSDIIERALRSLQRGADSV